MPGTPGPRTGLATINPTGETPSILRTTANAIISWLEANATPSSAGLLADRPTSTPSTPGIAGRRYYATDAGVEFRDTGTGWVAIGPVPEVTALPTSPVDQQECILILDATAGIKVHLRYRAASTSAYKWESVGAPAPLEIVSSVNWGAVTNTAYVNLTPSLVIPFGGDWDVEVFTASMGVDAANVAGYLSYKIGAAAAVDTDAINYTASGSNRDYKSLSFRRRKAAIAASTVLQVAGRVGTSGSNFFPNANAALPYGLRAWPVRLG